MNLTIAFITARKEPKFDWFMDSLRNQGSDFDIIAVDALASERNISGYDGPMFPIKEGGRPDAFITITKPKPNVWQGTHRITKDDWWAKSNALNTALCLCKTDWFASVDDRCVLGPQWLQSVREAMEANYAVCGSYRKHANMSVANGAIIDPGTVTGLDHRNTGQTGPVGCGGEWLYGCSFALPLEWALQVNGFNELLDGLGAEDTNFGSMLQANGFPIRYDPRMLVIQDRTPGECGPQMRRSSKERFQHDTRDKGHKAIEKFNGQKQSSHPWNIREMRASVLSGNPFPNTDAMPRTDWFDQMAIAHFQ